MFIIPICELVYHNNYKVLSEINNGGLSISSSENQMIVQN